MVIRFPDDLEWVIEADSIVTTQHVGSGRAKRYVSEIYKLLNSHYRLTLCPAPNATIVPEAVGGAMYVVRCTPHPSQTVDEFIADFQGPFPKNRFIQQGQGITSLLAQLGPTNNTK